MLAALLLGLPALDQLLLWRFLGLFSDIKAIALGAGDAGLLAFAIRRCPVDGEGIGRGALFAGFAVSLAVFLLGGEGRFFYASTDWQVRGAVLRDLTLHPITLRLRRGAGPDPAVRADWHLPAASCSIGHTVIYGFEPRLNLIELTDTAFAGIDPLDGAHARDMFEPNGAGHGVLITLSTNGDPHRQEGTGRRRECVSSWPAPSRRIFHPSQRCEDVAAPAYHRHKRWRHVDTETCRQEVLVAGFRPVHPRDDSRQLAHCFPITVASQKMGEQSCLFSSQPMPCAALPREP